MARILYCWELGGEYGHISSFLPVAQALRQRGHEVVFAVKDLSRIEYVLRGEGFRYLQAPVWLPEVSNLPEPSVSYAEILHRFGFLHPTELLAMAKAWRALYALVGPDLLVVDHGPTALLAARGLGLRRVMLGVGFFSPPRLHPLPTIRPWLPVPPARLVAAEQSALATANAVLTALDAPALVQLADLFDVDEDFLCTFAELDHYQGRGEARYWGPRFHVEGGDTPAWPDGEGARIFAYLKHECAGFDEMMRLLGRLPYRTLAHVPGLSEARRRGYETPRLWVSPRPVNMCHVGANCELAVCNAGMGTVAALLLAGRPLLLLPMHLEQIITARNVIRLGAGLVIRPVDQAADYQGLLERLLADRTFADQARAFAERHAGFDPQVQVVQIAQRCEEVLSGAG